MRAAATLLLVRDGAAGPEVLLVKRNSSGDFPGLHVFPGGLVDAADSHPALLTRSRRDAASAEALLGVGDALPWFVAALRECLEEVGVLPGLANGDGNLLRQWQLALNAREHSLADLSREHLPALATDELGYFSHWITPLGVPRRYDTRFFVARMPEGQSVQIDGHEAVAADWLRPADALEAHRCGDIRLIFPTIRNLEALSAYDSTDALLDLTCRPRVVPANLPKMQNTANGLRMLLPGDTGYEEA